VVVVGKKRRSQGVVAVKISKATKEEDLKEARLMSVIGRHPNIVRVEDCYYEESTQRLFMVMELMQGNLRALVESREDQKLSEPELKALTHGLASGLQHMHKHGRDGVVSVYCSILMWVGFACNVSHTRGMCSAHHHHVIII
jgi:serine/threonine protein kinase